MMISRLTVCSSQNVTVSLLPAFTGILYEKSEAISEGGPGAGASQGEWEENQHHCKQCLSAQSTLPGYLLLLLLLLPLQHQALLQLLWETDREETKNHSTLHTVAGSHSGVAKPFERVAGTVKCVIIIIIITMMSWCLQAPLIEYQENLLDWYVPYGADHGDGEGPAEEEIFQPWNFLCFIDRMINLENTHFLCMRPHVDVDGEVSDLY